MNEEVKHTAAAGRVRIKRVKLEAHAKLNLSLDVIGRRPDGYHLVDMIMQEVGLHDDIYIESDDSGEISLSVVAAPPTKEAVPVPDICAAAVSAPDACDTSVPVVDACGAAVPAPDACGTSVPPQGGGTIASHAADAGAFSDNAEPAARPASDGHPDGYNFKLPPAGPDNLMYRAAVLMKQAFGISQGIRMTLIKRIPMQAGLGGGSSDAAAVVKGIRSLFNINANDDCLEALTASLGADVPFFIRGGTRRATGTGTRLVQTAQLKETDDIFPGYVLIVKPACGGSTPRIYAAYDEAEVKYRQSITHPDVLAQAEALDVICADGAVPGKDTQKAIDIFCKNILNVLEYAVEERELICRIKEDLARSGAAASSMSGSGSAVYGLFHSRAGMHSAAAVLRGADYSRRLAGIYETHIAARHT